MRWICIAEPEFLITALLIFLVYFFLSNRVICAGVPDRSRTNAPEFLVALDLYQCAGVPGRLASSLVNLNVAGIPGLSLYGGVPADELAIFVVMESVFRCTTSGAMRLVVACCLRLSYILRLTVSGPGTR